MDDRRSPTVTDDGTEPSAAFTTTEAVPLAQALVDRLASAHGIRAIGLKGAFLEDQGLRSHHRSTDADVLVDPAHFDRFCRELRSLGWNERLSFETPSIVPLHSLSFVHPQWPCDIDVHHRYPGFFADEQDVFDYLWRGHLTRMEIAHLEVHTLDRVGNAMIMALHASRHPKSQRHRSELARLVEVVRTTFTEEERSALITLAGAGRAQFVASSFLSEAGIGHEPDLTVEEKALWSLYQSTNEEGSTSAWLLSLTRTGWWRRPTELLRAIYPSSSVIRYEHPESARTMLSRMRYRIRRIQRGLSALPHAVAEWRRYRHTRTQSAQGRRRKTTGN